MGYYKGKKPGSYRGYFLDLKTFTFALTNESYSLESALPDFGCKLRKEFTEKHGVITPK